MALLTRGKRGYYEDRRFKSLMDVVNHYDDNFALSLTDQEKDDLVQYPRSH